MPIIVPEELSDAHSVSCDSSLPPSTPSTSALDSRSHIARAVDRTLKHERRGSLGLIDAARVRISQDVSASPRAPICSETCLTRVDRPSPSLALASAHNSFARFCVPLASYSELRASRRLRCAGLGSRASCMSDVLRRWAFNSE